MKKHNKGDRYDMRSEKARITNLCMVYDNAGNVLVQERIKKDWPGITFPGGHVEYLESFHDAVVREVKEETGLDIKHPKLCGVKQFQTKEDERYIVFLYKTNEFSGELCDSSEGHVFWVKRSELLNYPLSEDFDELLKVFEDDELSEFYYDTENDWKINLY